MSLSRNQQLEQMNNEVNLLQSVLRLYFKSNQRVPIQHPGHVDKQK